MEEKEFLEKIRESRGLIIKICKMYFEQKQDQEDLFQEILLQSWKSVDAFKNDAKFSTWLYRVALNTAIVFFKKAKKIDIVKAEFSVLDKQRNGDDRIDVFYAAIHKLNKIEKALIIQYLDGLSGEEIAANMGFNPGNVRVKLNRTKKKLKSIIKIEQNEF